MQLTTDQLYQIAIAALGMLGALVTAKAMQWRAVAKKIDTEADNARDDNTTQNIAVKVITDRFARADDLNTTLQKELRECEVRETEQAGTIRDLQRMNHELGERNEQQGKLMMQTALELEATKRELQTVSAAFTAELARNGQRANGDGDGGEPP